MSLSLRDAWLVLGRDPEAVAEAVGSSKDQGAAADAELETAKKAARRLMGVHHPDKNGSPESYALVQEALRTVEEKTARFKASLEEVRERRGDAVFIEVDGA